MGAAHGECLAIEGLSAREQGRRQLLSLFRHGLDRGEWLELRCLDCRRRPAGQGPRAYFRSVTELVEAALKYRERWDVFFGVGTRRCLAVDDMNRCPHAKRGEDHVYRLPAAWGDFDVCSDDEPNKLHASLEVLLEKLNAAHPGPDVLVGSGTGVHAYWPLGEPAHELERVEAVNRAIRARLGGDNAIDAARILRVAGTFNHKHGRPLPVRLLACRDG